MARPRFNEQDGGRAREAMANEPPTEVDPRVEALVTELIGRVADKWTMLVPEALTEHGELRFTQLGRAVPGVSQKMLTQTVRQMERDGLVSRTIYPVVPPRVDHRPTALGESLGAAFCGVWIWAEENWRLSKRRERGLAPFRNSDGICPHRSRRDRSSGRRIDLNQTFVARANDGEA